MVSIVSQLHQTSRRFIWSSSGGASNKSPHHADCSDVTSYNWCNAAVIAHWTTLPLQYIYYLIIYRYKWSCCSMTNPALEWSKWAEWGSPPHQQAPRVSFVSVDLQLQSQRGAADKRLPNERDPGPGATSKHLHLVLYCQSYLEWRSNCTRNPRMPPPPPNSSLCCGAVVLWWHISSHILTGYITPANTRKSPQQWRWWWWWWWHLQFSYSLPCCIPPAAVSAVHRASLSPLIGYVLNALCAVINDPWWQTLRQKQNIVYF